MVFNNGDFQALMAEVVGHGQAFDAPATGQAVRDEIHAPHLVDRLGQLQRHPLAGWALGLLAPAHRQVGILVEPVDTFVVDPGKLVANVVGSDGSLFTSLGGSTSSDGSVRMGDFATGRGATFDDDDLKW